MRDPAAVCSAQPRWVGEVCPVRMAFFRFVRLSGLFSVAQTPSEILLAINPVQDAIRDMRQCVRLRRRWKEVCSRAEKKSDGP